MKKLNKKGFTLIELLAVIVILAILVTVSIPAVTKYLGTARKGTFVTNAQTAISAVRNHVISTGVINGNYAVSEVNNLFESGKKLTKSPYGKEYSSNSYVQVEHDDATNVTTYSICLIDTNGAGIALTEEGNLKDDSVKTTGVTCTLPTDLNTVACDENPDNCS